jgi:N6-L-threonylcarbamoyladenine synthase
MRILGIETSADETGVCLVEASGSFESDFSYKVLGNGLSSQIELHTQYGGIFPSLAKREHAKALVPMLEKALGEAGALVQTNEPVPGAMLIPLKQTLEREPELFTLLVPHLLRYQKPDIDCIAVTTGPGLEPALWVGINFARALAQAWDVPIVSVNHMEGHFILSLMDTGGLKSFEYPALALLISGGHTELVLSEQFGQYKRLGETRDDAAGEAFDKIARLLDLPYPGGPQIARLAAEARKGGADKEFELTPPMLNSKDYDFSFSGLKTEVRRMAERHAPLSSEARAQIALASENAIAEVLVKKTMRAVEEYGVQTVVVGGGVSANTFIKQQLGDALAKADSSAQLLVPPAELATDNAVMIALAGYFHAEQDEFAHPDKLTAIGNLRLET